MEQDRQRQAVVHYFNTLYNMQPDSVLLGRMKQISEERGIAPSEWMQAPLPRYCRD